MQQKKNKKKLNQLDFNFSLIWTLTNRAEIYVERNEGWHFRESGILLLSLMSAMRFAQSWSFETACFVDSLSLILINDLILVPPV
jgi:hypothetical protein